jgi:hypothetical protein
LLWPLSFAWIASAQAATPAPDYRNDMAAIRSKREEAKASARANNAVQAERALSDTNLSPAGTANWHLETAQKLIQLADDLARLGTPSPVLAKAALDNALRARPLANTPETALGARLVAGFVCERYLADRTAALGHYQAAVQLAPQSAAAREAIDRLTKIDEAFRQKGRGR